jgi:hypothetical protein
MSTVTNVILVAGVDELRAIAQVNEMIHRTHSHEDRPFTDANNHPVAGARVLETSIFLGAFNGIGLPLLLNIVQSAEWESPEEVQLFVKEQEDLKFTEVSLK